VDNKRPKRGKGLGASRVARRPQNNFYAAQFTPSSKCCREIESRGGRNQVRNVRARGGAISYLKRSRSNNSGGESVDQQQKEESTIWKGGEGRFDYTRKVI